MASLVTPKATTTTAAAAVVSAASSPRATVAAPASLVSVETVRATNWAGGIPTVVTLAPTSLSSPTIPPPVHILLPRHSFLHVGLRSAVLRLASFAPLQPTNGYGSSHYYPSSSGNISSQKIIRNESDAEEENDLELEEGNSNNSDTRRQSRGNNNNNNLKDSYPICWFEDEEGQTALRWHLFAGVLYDMTKIHRQQQQQQQASQQQQQLLPWKIRLHFTSYPHGQLLPLDSATEDAATSSGGVMATLQRSFKHSLKQALFLEHGNSRVSLNLTKQSYERLWESIVACNYSWYRQVNSTELEVSSNNNSSSSSDVNMLPIRLFIDSQPPQQRPCRPLNDNSVPFTLGDLLLDWAPQFFTKQPSSDTTVWIEPTLPHITWWIGGIQPPLTSSLLDLWRHLCHPDHMLYIILVTRPS